MASSSSVWGIDIGQAAFKALRCQVEDGKVVADAFDYIEYPKILSQPEAEPEKMIQDAIEQFLSRNDMKGHSVALAVPGQSGLAKFFKPPPVDAKKIPEIVKYEARQQIPFALEDVIWDFQQMGGGAEVDGYALETEVGLFAMKREQVYRAMKPFQDIGVELDIIQLAPLSIYNFVSFDILGEQLAAQDYDPDSPPPSLVVLSMGTDTTDLVITNGFRVWQRSVPLGGNHFTKQLTKELKLTFAKAEHLKRNARQAEDPKMVFQAMRPVFNDLVTEVQRSIGYFQGIDRKAKINGVVVLGNAVKLPGLQQYLAKNLGYEVNSYEAFSHLGGSTVTTAPAFRDNQLSYGVCYGLCLQGLGEAKLKTNLVPREIMTDRLIRSKKPWAVASLAALLLACTFNVFFYYSRLHQAAEDRAVSDVPWSRAISAASAADSVSKDFQSKDSEALGQLTQVSAIGEELVGNADRQLLWLEMLRTLNTALPVTQGLQPGEIPDVKKLPFDEREEIHIDQIETQYLDDLSTWFNDLIRTKYAEQTRDMGAPSDATDEATATTEVTGPTEAGWIIQLDCYHFFNKDRRTEGVTHVLDSIVDRLKNGGIVFPVAAHKIRPGNTVLHQGNRWYISAVTPIAPPADGSSVAGLEFELTRLDEVQKQPVKAAIQVAANDMVGVTFSMKEMGFDYPVVTKDSPINRQYKVPNPNFEPRSNYPGGDGGGYPGGSMGGVGGMSGLGGVGGMSGMSGMGGVGGMSGMSGMGGSNPGSGGSVGGTQDKESDEEIEPPMLVVPRFKFTLQVVWKEVLLSDRLQKQVDEWEQKKLELSGTTDSSELAANTSGGT